MRRRTFKQIERWIHGIGAGFSPLLASAAGGPGGPGGPLDPRPAAPEKPAEPEKPAAHERTAEPERPTAPRMPFGARPEPPDRDSDARPSDDADERSVLGPPSPHDDPPLSPEEPREGRHRRFAGKVKKGLVSVVASSYDARADDLEERAVRAMRKALVDERSHILEVAREMYDARADDLQTRAVATLRRLFEDEHQRMLEFVQRSYDSRADDLEERAVRAMRSAVQREADRIESLIEHSVHVKRREVRLSLLVLVIANLIYLLVYWLTGAGR